MIVSARNLAGIHFFTRVSTFQYVSFSIFFFSLPTRFEYRIAQWRVCSTLYCKQTHSISCLSLFFALNFSEEFIICGEWARVSSGYSVLCVCVYVETSRSAALHFVFTSEENGCLRERVTRRCVVFMHSVY